MWRNLFGLDNCLQLDSQICVNGKKKLTGKRITGLQVTILNFIVVFIFPFIFYIFMHLKIVFLFIFKFCPNDVNKVMVTSADSQVQILRGTDIVCKFKGVD